MSEQSTTRTTPVRLRGPVPCDGSLLTLPAGRYDWVRFLVEPDGASAGPADLTGLDEEVWLHYREGADPEWLRATAPAEGGRCTARVAVPRRSELLAVRLPRRPGVVVLAADCVGPIPTGV